MNQFTWGEWVWIGFGALALGVVVAVTLAVILSVVHDIRNPQDKKTTMACPTCEATMTYTVGMGGECGSCKTYIG